MIFSSRCVVWGFEIHPIEGLYPIDFVFTMGFGVVYDPGQNVKIVRAVEKCPVLYDYRKYPLVEFKTAAEKAWTEVALEIGISEGNCKNRWTNIKACFKRYLKNIIRNKNTKTYYLANDLKFMLPFMNLDIEFGDNLHHDIDSTDSITEEDVSRNSHEVMDMEISNDFELNTEAGNEFEVKLVDSDGEEESFFISTSNQSDDIIGNYNDQSADWDFFSSLLPDVRRMDNEQKKKFRNALLTAIDTVLYGEDF